MNYRKWKNGILALLLILSMTAVTACAGNWKSVGTGTGTSTGTGTGTSTGTSTQGKTSQNIFPYSAQQMLLVVLSQRQRLEKVYTDKIWDTAISDDGTTYREIFLNEMKDFFLEMAAMNLMAEDENVKLSSGEKKKLETAARQFYTDSVESSAALKGLTEEETAEIFKAYYTAKKTEEALITGKKVEVSDSEAKVIEIEQIVLTDADTASQVLQKAQGGADFYGLAQSVTADAGITRKAGHGDLPEAVEKAAFQLENDGISNVIPADGKYYIVKCINSYDREETEIRKKTMERERLNTTVRKAYEAFAAQHPLTIDEAVWNRVASRATESYSGRDFFTSLKEGTDNGGV